MTPETDPGQTPARVTSIVPAQRDRAIGRHPVMAIPTRPIPPRTLPDADIERGARLVGMVDGERPRHRQGPPVRKRDALLQAVRRALPGMSA
jgi:hypothetical protein